MKPLWVIPCLVVVRPGITCLPRAGIYTRITQEVIHGDTVTVAELMPAFRLPAQDRYPPIRRWSKNLKKVYPIAKEANRLLQEMEKHMGTLKTKREQQQLSIKAMERKLKEHITPHRYRCRMTFSTGQTADQTDRP